MNRRLRIVCAVALTSTLGLSASAQNRPPEPAPKPPAKRTFPTPGGTPTSDVPALTTNARAQADAEHKAALAKCDNGPKGQRDDCVHQADEQYDRALAGENQGEQGNPGSNTPAKGTGLN